MTMRYMITKILECTKCLEIESWTYHDPVPPRKDDRVHELLCRTCDEITVQKSIDVTVKKVV